MIRSHICTSFVGIFNGALSWIPNLDNRFCRELFGKPYETMNGMTPEGYTIAINNKPFPMVIINPEKLIVKGENIETLAKYTESLIRELERCGLKDVGFSAYGINGEYQWLELPANADIWICEHFMKDSIFNKHEYHVCNNLNFRINHGDTQYLNVDIAPRVGIRDGLYANINHHHNQSIDVFPDTAAFFQLIKESEKIVEDNIILSLIENH